jgi:hypothetical protein
MVVSFLPITGKHSLMADITIIMKGPVPPNLGGPPPASPTAAPWGYSVDNDGQGFSQGGTIIDGGRGIDPVFVKNLNQSGAGSLQDAYRNNAGHIVFEVGGIIPLDGQQLDNRNAGNQTIWGNTAPGGHVNVQGNPSVEGLIQVWNGNLIIKHVRFRGVPVGISQYDAIQLTDNAGTKTPQNVLIENCSFSTWTDGMNDIYLVNNSNYNFYRCLFAWPSVAGHHNQAPHNNGPIVRGKAADRGSRCAHVECLQAGCKGRPHYLDFNDAVWFSHFYYMWKDFAFLLDPTTDGFWAEGCRWKTQNSGAVSPLYNGADQGQGTQNECIKNDGVTNFYVANNDYGGVTPVTGAGSDARATVLAAMDMPDDFVNKLDVDFWTDANLAANIALVGANPTTTDSVDAAARNGIINGTYKLIDDAEDIPGGVPTTAAIPNASHETGALGQTLESYIEAQLPGTTKHDVMPGYANRTKLEVLLDSFVSGVPT